MQVIPFKIIVTGYIQYMVVHSLPAYVRVLLNRNPTTTVCDLGKNIILIKNMIKIIDGVDFTYQDSEKSL